MTVALRRFVMVDLPTYSAMASNLNHQSSYAGVVPTYQCFIVCAQTKIKFFTPLTDVSVRHVKYLKTEKGSAARISLEVCLRSRWFSQAYFQTLGRLTKIKPGTTKRSVKTNMYFVVKTFQCHTISTVSTYDIVERDGPGVPFMPKGDYLSSFIFSTICLLTLCSQTIKIFTDVVFLLPL